MYSIMVDQRKWELQDSLFCSDATIDYSSVGNGGKLGDYREMLQWLDDSLQDWPMNLHFITNEIIDVNGDEATSICCFNAPMAQKDEKGHQTSLTNSGYYHDKMIRTNMGWRIKERICDMTLQIFHG